jgi:hypothetical protein
VIFRLAQCCISFKKRSDITRPYYTEHHWTIEFIAQVGRIYRTLFSINPKPHSSSCSLPLPVMTELWLLAGIFLVPYGMSLLFAGVSVLMFVFDFDLWNVNDNPMGWSTSDFHSSCFVSPCLFECLMSLHGVFLLVETARTCRWCLCCITFLMLIASTGFAYA